MSTLYSIADWQDAYENNRSRIVNDLTWVPVPNRHDGESYARLMLRKDAPEIFTVWILLLQVASQGKKPRGRLIRDNGTAHDFVSLALKTRGKEAWFKKALPVLLELGWVLSEVIDSQSDGTTLAQGDATVPQDGTSGKQGDEEGNGKKEEKEAVLPFESEVFRQGWESWMAYRKFRRFDAYAPQGIAAQFSKFKEWGEPLSLEAMSESIRNNWQGLFPPKVNGKPYVKPTPARVGKAY